MATLANIWRPSEKGYIGYRIDNFPQSQHWRGFQLLRIGYKEVTNKLLVTFNKGNY